MGILTLLALVVLAVAGMAQRAERRGGIRRGERLRVWGMLAGLVAWAVVSGLLASRGVYLTETFLRWLPGLWLPLVAFALVAAALAASAPLRRGWIGTFDSTPPEWLVWIHALRVSALGTLFKTIAGDFPLSFELGVGVPDLAFGLSAPFVAHALRRGAIGWRGLALWHLTGFATVGLPALVIGQLGLPGPLQLFDAAPTAEALFVYPMALAPTVLVPCFLMLNLASAAWLIARRPALPAQPDPA